MAAGVPHLEIPNYPGPVQHNANLGEREAHLSLSLVHYLSIGFGRLPNLMRIFISGDGYDRVGWLCSAFVQCRSVPMAIVFVPTLMDPYLCHFMMQTVFATLRHV